MVRRAEREARKKGIRIFWIGRYDIVPDILDIFRQDKENDKAQVS